MAKTTLTRRDFEFFAATIKALPLSARERAKVATHFAKAFSLTNPRFDRTIFLDACGIDIGKVRERPAAEYTRIDAGTGREKPLSDEDWPS